MAYVPFLMLEESIEESEKIDMIMNGIKPSKPKCECVCKPKKEPEYNPPPLPYDLDNHTNYEECNKCSPRYMPNCCVSCLRNNECSCKKKSL